MSELNSKEEKGVSEQKVVKNGEVQVQIKDQKPKDQNNKPHDQKAPQTNAQTKQESHSVNNQKEEQKLTSLSSQKLALKAELQSMQFEPYLIDQALQQVTTLDQAIEFIINKLQSNQKEQLGLSQEVKLFFIVRMDLKMSTGKIAAQVGHASLRAFQNMRYSCSTNDQSATLLIEWMQNGKKTKILQAETQKDLLLYLDKAGNRFINNCYIRDAGRTQVAAGSMTVAAIGPVRECDADFLKQLKEY